MSDYQDHASATITVTAKKLRALLELPGMTTRNVAAFTGTTKSLVSRASRGMPVNTRDFLALAKWVDDQSSP